MGRDAGSSQRFVTKIKWTPDLPLLWSVGFRDCCSGLFDEMMSSSAFWHRSDSRCLAVSVASDELPRKSAAGNDRTVARNQQSSRFMAKHSANYSRAAYPATGRKIPLCRMPTPGNRLAWLAMQGFVPWANPPTPCASECGEEALVIG